MRHRNETCGWHVCAGRVTHVVDLDPTAARTGPHDGGAGRAADPRGHRRPKTTPRTNHDTASRRCVKTLRGQERPADCGDTRRRFRRRGLARARATPRERIDSAGRCGRGGRAPRQRNRARRLSQAGEVLKRKIVSDEPKDYRRYIYTANTRRSRC